MKTCSHCKTKKPLTEFNKRKSEKDGLHYCCRSCCILGHLIYYKAHPEKQKSYAKNNPEKQKAWNAIHRSNNSEKIKARDNAYYKALSDSLMKSIIQISSGIPKNLITQEFIQAKRIHMQIKQKLKELKA